MAKMVSPSILSADFANLEREIKNVTEAGADWLHVDVMDGHFVNNLTIGAPVVASLAKVTKIPLDVHLMIENPEKYVDDFAKAGSHYITIHVETSQDPASLLRRIRALGCKPGITLRPRTQLATIQPFLTEVDLVLVMTVEPGFSGQSFREDQVPKMKQLKDWREQQNLHFLIEVDGGVNDKTVALCQDADVFVAGNFVFKNNYAEAIRILKTTR